MPATRSQTKPSDTNRIPDIDRTCSQGVPGPIIEWLDLDFSEMSPVKQMNWRNSLNEIQAFEGCRHITFACPLELAHRLWIIIRKDSNKINRRETYKWIHKSGCQKHTEMTSTEQAEVLATPKRHFTNIAIMSIPFIELTTVLAR